MGSKKLMTNPQGLYVAKLGRDEGLTAHQADKAIADGTFKLAITAAKTGRRIGYILEPPAGGRVHIVRATVQLDREWQEAINAGCPQTPAEYNVRKVGNLYLPTGKGVVEREYFLLNNNRSGFDAALKWAEQYKLNVTDPREIFAVAEYKPELHRELGMSPMYLVATKECQYMGHRQACYAWWHDAKRKAYLCWVEDFNFAYDWFAFSLV